MGELVLIRHGQANSAAKTEAGYDVLTDLGWQQAVWLGEWLREKEGDFDATLCGSLHRHVQTAEALGLTAPKIDARLNELDYFNLADAFREATGDDPKHPDDFPDYISRVMEAWHRAEIQGDESFASFEERVTAALMEAAQIGRRVLCVTSGGVISMMVRHLLGLDPARMGRVLIPILNTSIHRVTVHDHGMLLNSFNGAPHLEHAERAYARTMY